MGKDFRTGLVLGLMLSAVALVWVATRPSLRPQARMAQPSQTGSAAILPSGNAQPRPDQRTPALQESAPAQGNTTNALPAVRNPQPEQPAASGPEAESTYSGPTADSGLPDLTVYEQHEKIKTTRFHIVRRGETLSGISRQYYGTAENWRRILAANRQTIKDPNKITPGTKLILPE
jgi:5'-nucleotidase/UDP-sugar diphosphatase